MCVWRKWEGMKVTIGESENRSVYHEEKNKMAGTRWRQKGKGVQNE